MPVCLPQFSLKKTMVNNLNLIVVLSIIVVKNLIFSFLFWGLLVYDYLSMTKRHLVFFIRWHLVWRLQDFHFLCYNKDSTRLIEVKKYFKINRCYPCIDNLLC